MKFSRGLAGIVTAVLLGSVAVPLLGPPGQRRDQHRRGQHNRDLLGRDRRGQLPVTGPSGAGRPAGPRHRPGAARPGLHRRGWGR